VTNTNHKTVLLLLTASLIVANTDTK